MIHDFIGELIVLQVDGSGIMLCWRFIDSAADLGKLKQAVERGHRQQKNILRLYCCYDARLNLSLIKLH